MNKMDVVRQLLEKKSLVAVPQHKTAKAFAPTNIALIKYWGKRDNQLNLPVTSSLSISLGQTGTETTIGFSEQDHDVVVLNQQIMPPDHVFAKRLRDFLNLFRATPDTYFVVNTISHLPVAAGLASSASGFAALIQALDQLFAWQLAKNELSILARLGSGSACRSLWSGFVEWTAGQRSDGMDSVGHFMDIIWPDLRIGLLILTEHEKTISSRVAMEQTKNTSDLYKIWPEKVAKDLTEIKTTLINHDFVSMGKIAETNALAMHATMLTADPPILYSNAQTIEAMHKIWALRQAGLPIYFTQDAGPNLKLLFLKQDERVVLQHFPTVSVIHPFN